MVASAVPISGYLSRLSCDVGQVRLGHHFDASVQIARVSTAASRA